MKIKLYKQKQQQHLIDIHLLSLLFLMCACVRVTVQNSQSLMCKKKFKHLLIS